MSTGPRDTSEPGAKDMVEMFLRLLAMGASVRGVAGIFGVSKSTMGRLLAGIDATAAAEALSRMGQQSEQEPQKCSASIGESVPTGTGGAA